jgi:hypothetical protein
VTRKSDEAREVRAFVKRRNRALLSGLGATIRFARKQGIEFPNREVAELAFHKMRTAVRSLPLEIRRASHAWLKARGAKTLDDGDLGVTENSKRGRGDVGQ